MLAPRPKGLSEEEPPLAENDLGDCTGLVDVFLRCIRQMYCEISEKCNGESKMSLKGRRRKHDITCM